MPLTHWHNPSLCREPLCHIMGFLCLRERSDPCRRTIAMGGASPRSIDSSTALGYSTVRYSTCKKAPCNDEIFNKICCCYSYCTGRTGFGVFPLGNVTTPAFLSEHTEHPQFAQGWVRKPQFHFPLKPKALDQRCLIWRHSSGCSRSSPPHVAESAFGSLVSPFAPRSACFMMNYTWPA